MTIKKCCECDEENFYGYINDRCLTCHEEQLESQGINICLQKDTEKDIWYCKGCCFEGTKKRLMGRERGCETCNHMKRTIKLHESL